MSMRQSLVECQQLGRCLHTVLQCLCREAGSALSNTQQCPCRQAAQGLPPQGLQRAAGSSMQCPAAASAVHMQTANKVP